MKILGLIPARGGSKGVSEKNLKPLLGRSLVERAHEAGAASRVLDRIVLSTDSQEIASHGAAVGIEVPFLRPAVLASDTAPMIGVVQHTLAELAREGYVPEAMVLLQPTSPLRTPSHIRRAVDLLGELDDAVCSVVPLPKEICPHYVMKIQEGSLSFFLPEGALYTRRQDVPQAYRRDGTVYLTRTVTLLAGSFYGDRCVPMILEPDECITIDSGSDWTAAEQRLLALEYRSADPYREGDTSQTDVARADLRES